MTVSPNPTKAQDQKEIVVTARRLEERLRDVPLAISSVRSDQIGAGAVDRLQSLSSHVPGLFFETIWGGGNSFPILRGQNQPNIQGDNVGLFVDGVYQANRDAIDVEPLDLERIEVVKGPQSALFGRSTFAGLINYVSAKPTEEWLLKTSADFATDHYLAGRVAISGPVNGAVKFRFAAAGRTVDGTWSNAAAPAHRLGNSRLFAVAGTIATRDNAGPLELILSARYSAGQSNQPPFYRLDYPSYNCGGRDAISGAWSYFCGKPPIPDQLTLSPDIGDSRSHGGQIAIHASLDLGATVLEADSSYYDAIASEIRDMDASAGGQLFGVCLISFNCSVPNGVNLPVLRFVAINSVQLRQAWAREFSQELRFGNHPGGPLGWQVGASAVWTRSRVISAIGAERKSVTSAERLTSLVYSDPLRVGSLAALNAALVDDPNSAQIIQNDNITDRRSLALFAVADWRATQRLNLRGELRATWERFALDSRISQFQPSFGTSFGKRTFAMLTPRFSAAYRPSSNWLLFASYARGARSGGINTVLGLAPVEQIFAPETNWTAEIGAKYHGRGLLRSLEATAYHIDWRNVQITGLSATPGITALITRNTRGTENWGIELSAQASPATWLDVDGSLSFTHPRFKQGSEDPGSNGYCGLIGGVSFSTLCRVRQSDINPKQLVPDISGNVPARTVEWSWAVGVDVKPRSPVLHRMRLHLGLSYQSDVNDRQIGGLYYGEHLLMDGRVSLPLGPITLELWGTNLTDTRYIRVAAGSSGPQFFINQPRPTDLLLSDGRRIGVTMRYPN